MSSEQLEIHEVPFSKMSPTKTKIFLYAAYVSTCLEDRAWSFCVSLCMDLIGGMRLVSIEQLFEGLLQMLLSGYLGKLFDKLSRKAACLSIDSPTSIYTICLISAMLLCAINRLFLNAEKFITGRDWVVVLGDNKTLSNMNATLTTLDQFTNVIAPIITGMLISFFNLRLTVAIFGIGSLVSMCSKSFFLRSIYISNEKLQLEKAEPAENKEKLNRGVIATYFYQSTFPAAFGMSLLFMTVMGFDGLAVGYGTSAGLPEYILGIFRSYGSITGILGAFSYAIFEKKFSVRMSGILGLITQQIFALIAVISIWLPGSPMNLSGYFGNFTIQIWWNDMIHSFDAKNQSIIEPHIDWKHFTSNGISLDSIFIFLIAIATARYGLWCLDLAITHIMQIGIAEKERNTVFGVHNSLCQTFSVLKDLLVIVLPLPATFGLCILISYGFVTCGHLFFVFYLIKSKVRQEIVRL